MENNVYEILRNTNGNPFGGLVINMAHILRFPIIIILFANLLFAILLFLRVRILLDTLESSHDGLIKMLVSLYLIFAILGSIIAVLFLLLG